ncbi:MAG: GNAT family N-acetyltransferase [Euryarchaeota archaeon]|nr:GNAT family N-acetyltransferase [Euryarchaeota archaeon]
MSSQIGFCTGGCEILDSVKDMWEKLIHVSSIKSTYFSHYIQNATWDAKKDTFIKKAAEGSLRVDLATLNEENMGFCVSSIVDGIGEVEALFVEECSRGHGVGKTLLQRAIEWMKINGTRVMNVVTVYGDDDIMNFYAKQGYRPISIMLANDQGPTCTEHSCTENH